jgi:hypothetical protein
MEKESAKDWIMKWENEEAFKKWSLRWYVCEVKEAIWDRNKNRDAKFELGLGPGRNRKEKFGSSGSRRFMVVVDSEIYGSCCL